MVISGRSNQYDSWLVTHNILHERWPVTLVFTTPPTHHHDNHGRTAPITFGGTTQVPGEELSGWPFCVCFPSVWLSVRKPKSCSECKETVWSLLHGWISRFRMNSVRSSYSIQVRCITWKLWNIRTKWKTGSLKVSKSIYNSLLLLWAMAAETACVLDPYISGADPARSTSLAEVCERDKRLRFNLQISCTLPLQASKNNRSLV